MTPDGLKWIFVGGMIRSGSTLQYQIAKHLVEERLGGGALGFLEASEIDTRLEEAESSPATRFPCVVKSHACTPGIRARLERGDAVAFYTYRDIRDIAISGSRNFKIPLDEFISGHLLDQAIGESYLWTSCPGVSTSSFEFLMGDMVSWIGGMVEFLGIDAEEQPLRELAAAHSIERQKERMRTASHVGMGGFLVDPGTLLHREHIDRGAIGGWRTVLHAEQVAAIEKIAGDWMAGHGYEFSSAESLATPEDRAKGIRCRAARQFQECDRILLERETLLRELSAQASGLRIRLAAAEEALRRERGILGRFFARAGLLWRGVCRRMKRFSGSEN